MWNRVKRKGGDTMTSYASVDRIEGEFAVLEVELIPMEQSQRISASEKETKMINIEMQIVESACGTIREGDVILIECNDKEVIKVYCKDEKEKERREEVIRKLLEK